jgi:peptidoglycan/xylan/chitin deacetylase (PgdA/CDA1 family)
MKPIFLRIDDIGASTKKFEIYSKKKFANILFFKYLKYFRAWAPYSELTCDEWEQIFEILTNYNAKLTVGVTAAWVEKDNTLVPFPEKYPEQADILKSARESGLIEVANHGLTHCVVGQHLPRMFTSNRKYHREFWDWVPRDIHFEHLEKSQKIFNEWLGKLPTTLIPPGNVYSVDTLNAAEKYGIKRINSYFNHDTESRVKIIDSNNIDAFHDRELVLYGVKWLKDKIKSYPDDTNFKLLRDL